LCLGKPIPLGVVRVLWLCMEIQPGSVGALENWSIGMKAKEYDVFLFLYLALLHYSLAQTWLTKHIYFIFCL